MTILGNFIKESLKINKFKPCTAYYSGLDMLLYLQEDCSYVSVITDLPNVNILYHPNEQTKVVGIAIYNYAQIFKNLRKKSKYLLTDLFDDTDNQELIGFADTIILTRKEITPNDR